MLSVLAAHPLAAFFSSPDLRPVVVVLGIGFLLRSFETVPIAMLQRELRFPTVAIIDGVEAVLTVSGTVALAVAGFRYWALVGGSRLSARKPSCSC